MQARKLPLGVDSFEKLREEGFYYVDKSLLIRDLLSSWGEVNLFTRPRRFGKTLNMSMLKSFFDIGGDKSVFNDLAIMGEPQLCDEYMGKFPVVFVTLKDADGLTFDEAKRRMASVICQEARRLSFLLDSEVLARFDKEQLEDIIYSRWEKVGLADSLKALTALVQKHYKQKAILIIDEYDVPLDKAYQRGYYNEMINIIRAMFSAALKTNDSLQFAVMTGCLRVSKESIFTGLNNLKIHSITDAQFDEYFGFTGEEVEKLMAYYNLGGHIAETKDWYDGYRFGKQDVYCPWDVINYCYDLLADDEKKPQAYWLNTSGNDMVRRLIDKANTTTTRMEIERLISGESIRKTLNDKLTHNEIDKNINNIWSLLFMTGYLTMTGMPDGRVYELVIPNKEVREIFMEQVLSWFDDKAKAQTDMLTDLYAAFETGDAGKIEDLLNKQLLGAISFHDAHESFYHGFLLAFANTCANWQVTSNRETGKGRSDVLIESADGKFGCVVEVKDVRRGRASNVAEKLLSACRTAIKQIEDRDYTQTLRRYRVENIWIYAIAFCDKECKVIAKRMT